MKRFCWLMLAGALTVPAHAAGLEPSRPAASAATSALAAGEVLEIDAPSRRVLVKHGPIASLGMDAMTMEFLVPNRKLLQKLRAGDRIRFAVVWRKGEYEITRAEVTARPQRHP